MRSRPRDTKPRNPPASGSPTRGVGPDLVVPLVPGLGDHTGLQSRWRILPGPATRPAACRGTIPRTRSPTAPRIRCTPPPPRSPTRTPGYSSSTLNHFNGLPSAVRSWMKSHAQTRSLPRRPVAHTAVRARPQAPLPPLPPGHFQALLPREAEHALAVDAPTLRPQKRPDLSVAVARVLGHQFQHPLHQGVFPVPARRPLPLRRAVLPQHPIGPALGDTEGLDQVLDCPAPPARAQKFFSGHLLDQVGSDALISHTSSTITNRTHLSPSSFSSSRNRPRIN